MVFNQKNVISISDFSKDDIEYILRLSEKMEPIARSQKTVKCTFWKNTRNAILRTINKNQTIL